MIGIARLVSKTKSDETMTLFLATVMKICTRSRWLLFTLDTTQAPLSLVVDIAKSG